MDNRVEDKNIFFNILGFTAPVGDLSSSGTAGYEYRLYDYKLTEYCVTIDKKDSDKTKFRLAIQRSKSEPVKLSHLSKKSFIEIISDYDS